MTGWLPALLAGLVQGVTGFGAGVLLMLFYPLLFSVAQSSAPFFARIDSDIG